MVTLSGVQTLFNFNPLIKLDGYYLLSDWLEIPNLQQRAGDYVKSRLRWLLWGAPRPAAEPQGRLLLAYGLVSWVYSLSMLALVYVALLRTVGPRGGVFGLAGVGLLGLVSTRGLFHHLSAGEVSRMIRQRRRRSAGWACILVAVPALLVVTPWEDRVGGSFQVRPALRCELRAAVAGFIQAVQVGEGDRVEPGAIVVRLGVPDLASRLAQKRAEVREARSKLSLLQAGPRPEEVLEQGHRVDRTRTWRDQAERDLARTGKALDWELARLDEQIAQANDELSQARTSLQRAGRLLAGHTGGAISLEEYGEANKRYRVCRHQVEQARNQKQARQALGTQEAEAELARRQKELADAQGALTLLQAGSRPEEVEAERARLARLQEEASYLQGMQARLQVCSPGAGVITTPHLKEKIGQYVREGDLIAVVEEPAALEAEITLAEQDVARVQPGQPVALKARALPFETFPTQVDRVAPAAGRGDVQNTVIVYCRLTTAGEELRPGMSGYARIDIGRRSVGAILRDRGLRYVHTEFWW
jgi:multidrug efflux pump subunit AcrA (membrane-fusion protein)